MDLIYLTTHVRLDDDEKLYRFLDVDGLTHTLGQNGNPTFILRSLKYYQNLEDKNRQDKYENTIVFTNRNNLNITSKNINHCMTSCWAHNLSPYGSILWQKFEAIACIETTVGKVRELIQSFYNRNPLKSCQSFLPNNDGDGKVIYYKNHEAELLLTHNNTTPMSFHGFYKRHEYFSEENEYRFNYVFDFKKCFDTDTAIFELDDISYIDKIYLVQNNPKAISFMTHARQNKIEVELLQKHQTN